MAPAPVEKETRIAIGTCSSRFREGMQSRLSIYIIFQSLGEAAQLGWRDSKTIEMELQEDQGRVKVFTLKLRSALPNGLISNLEQLHSKSPWKDEEVSMCRVLISADSTVLSLLLTFFSCFLSPFFMRSTSCLNWCSLDLTRIVNPDKCKPKKCRQECKKSCPVVRMGEYPRKDTLFPPAR